MSGATSTARAINLPPEAAIRFFLGKTNTPSQGWSDVWQEAHARAFMVAGAASDALLSDFRAAIAKALEQGTTLAEFRADFDTIVARNGWAHTGTPGWRAQIIYETNLSMAYSAGRYAQLTEPDTLAAFPYWQYVHSGAAHPRKQHLAWNGLTLRADDPFWKTHYPPNGWKCGCRVRPLSARDLGRQGKQGPDAAPPIQLRPWRRPSDGQILQVPDGIDPGFAYNVGEAWAQRRPTIPGDARLTPPPGWVPPVPVVPAAATAPRAMPLPMRPPVRRANPSDAVKAQDAALRTAYRPWASGLAAEERDAVDAYRRGGKAINRALRAKELLAPPIARIVDRLKTALGRAVVPEAMTVTRGVSSAEASAYGAAGSVGELGAFVSTTINPDVAGDFARLVAGYSMEIRISAGTRGAAYIHNVPTTRPPQFELLLAPGLRYRVMSRRGRRLVLEVYDERG